jgi:trk system potassium uptake protein
VTNAEEVNILSAMLAKRLGLQEGHGADQPPSYAELVEAGTIDIAISPQQITLGSLLAHVRRGDVVKVHAAARARAEAIEAVAHGDQGRRAWSAGAIDRDQAAPRRDDQRHRARRGSADGAHHDTWSRPTTT